MRLWCFSDTHTFHNKLSIPEVDIMIFAGDCSNSRNPYENELETRRFLEWYSILPCDNKVYIDGNHSTHSLKRLIRKEEYPNLIWLEHESANVKGLNIFGSPYTPRYGTDWAFNYKRNVAKVYWDSIPDNTNVIVTHGPCKGMLDLTDDKDSGNLVQVGCKALYNRVMEVNPSLHIFGHIHSENGINNYGIYKGNYKTTFVNASCLNHHTAEIYNGHILEI
jgi:Icc-related predicted phosphoesterase